MIGMSRPAPKFKRGDIVSLVSSSGNRLVGKIFIIDWRGYSEAYKGCAWSYDLFTYADEERHGIGEPLLYKHVPECDLEPSESNEQLEYVLEEIKKHGA